MAPSRTMTSRSAYAAMRALWVIITTVVPIARTSSSIRVSTFSDARESSDGYSITHAEVDPDALGIASPVFNRRGEVVAGLSIVALDHRIDAEEREQITEALLESASRSATCWCSPRAK